MKLRLLHSSLAIIALLSSLCGQDFPAYPPPMDIPLYLSGNFGEMRRNHFHTGLDMKTQGRQGIPVKSIADGFVSRVKVSPSGYGKVLYLDHPKTGHTSVYAHLRSFNDSISEAMYDAQYDAELWALDHYPEPGSLPVSAGEVIGYSGNSGSSSGPHLHFEIRDTPSERPLNPLLFGIDVKDDVYPTFKGLRLYQLDRGGRWSGEYFTDHSLRITKGGRYELSGPVELSGRVGIGVIALDHMTGTSSRFGLYELEVVVNDERRYRHRMDTLDFETFRQVNCHMDYPSYLTSGVRWQRCFPSEGNRLTIYQTSAGSGIIHCQPGEEYFVQIIARDFHGQERRIQFQLKGVETRLEPPEIRDPGVLLDASRDILLKDSSIVLRIPKGRIYEDYRIRLTEEEMPAGAISQAYSIRGPHIPLDDYITVRMKPLRTEDVGRTCILRWSDHRGRMRGVPGQWKDGWFEAKVKELGRFYLWPDERAPKVSKKTLPSSSKSSIRLEMSDPGGSGLDSIRVTVDGKWLRMAHNTSMTRAWGDVKELELDEGRHDVRIELWDAAGNSSRMEESIEL